MKKRTPNRVKIVVTKKDIKRGKMQERKSCPIALAIKRTVPYSFLKVWRGVMEYSVDWDGAFEESESLLPKKAERFIERFDNFGRKAVKPFSFFLKLPQK